MILARHAEALLWAGRYLERAETTARCLNVATASIMHLVPADAEVEWEQLIAALGLVDEFGGADADLSVVSVRRFLLTDATSPGSVRSAVTAVRENFRAVRDRIPVELWEEANRLHLELAGFDARYLPTDRAYEVMTLVRRSCQAMAGVLSESMLREEGHAFITIGQMVERAILNLELLKSALGNRRNTFDADRLLRSASALQAFRRQHGHDDDWLDVSAFLIEDQSVPRSVLASVTRIENRLEMVDVAGLLLEPRRLAGRLRSRLEYADLRAELADDAYGTVHGLGHDLMELSASIHDSLAPPLAVPTLHAQYVRPGRDTTSAESEVSS